MRVRIRPLGRVRRRALTGLRRRLAEALRVPVTVAEDHQYLGTRGYSRLRDQYRADALLDRLYDQVQVAKDDVCLLGVTEADIYIPDHNFLFGYAYLSGRCALLSLYQLDNREDGSAVTRQLLDRASKIAIHETAHAFGLEHCRDAGCVMRYADQVGAVDKETGRFCRDCRSELRSLVAAS